MKKNGFTLVEMLAVIAILAVLVIILVPNIVSIFNNSKKDTFIVDIKSRFNTIDLNMMKQSVKESDGTVFYRLVGDENTVPLTGKKFYYYVKVSISGKITEMLIWDGTNTLKKQDSNGINITELSTDDIDDNLDPSNMSLEEIKQLFN